MIPTHLRAAFADQAESCTALGSHFMGQLCTLFATREWPDTPLRDRIFRWSGDISGSGHSLPLRLAGALHALRLNGDATLATVYPPAQIDDDTLWAAVSPAFKTQGPFIDDWINSPPQTNEVRRSAALIGIGHWLTDQFGLPIKLSELGASAGLNLMWDHFALDVGSDTFGSTNPALTLTPDWRGPVPPVARPVVAERRGVDLNPLDPHNDALRLRAYLWPDQPHRMALTEAAIAVAAAPVDRADAIDWLGTRLTKKPGHAHLIYHTVAWQYFPKDAQDRGCKLIEAAGAHATDTAPLAWFGMEADGDGPGAALTLRLWPGDLTIPFGRADFHGRWIDWSPPA